MQIREKIDIIRASVDIVKTKLMYFIGLVGGDFYLLLNYDKITQFFNSYLIFSIFAILGIYATMGVFINLNDLNLKKVELEELK